jgi:hypothetical protein
MKLPKAEQNLEEWQTATEALLMAAEDRGPLMHARIGMLRAINRHVERTFDSTRKDTHWGRRKPARDPIEPRKKLIAGVFALPSPGALKAEPTSA